MQKIDMECYEFSTISVLGKYKKDLTPTLVKYGSQSQISKTEEKNIFECQQRNLVTYSSCICTMIWARSEQQQKIETAKDASQNLLLRTTYKNWMSGIICRWERHTFVTFVVCLNFWKLFCWKSLTVLLAKMIAIYFLQCSRLTFTNINFYLLALLCFQFSPFVAIFVSHDYKLHDHYFHR